MSISLSKKFVSEFMPMAPPTFVLVYIYGVSCEEKMYKKEVAHQLRLTIAELEEAFTYWAEKEIITLHDATVSYLLENKEIEFVDHKPRIQQVKSLNPFDVAADVEVGYEEESLPEKELEKEFEFQSIETKPTYSPAEIERYMEESVDIAILFATAERLFGKALSTTELNTLLIFYEYYRLPTEVIEEMLAYSIDHGHKGWRYIEKVALDWADSGIDTIEKAKNKMKAFNHEYRQFMQALGVSNDYPTKKQQIYFDEWLNTGLSMEVLVEALERTVISTGQASFPYADAIIKDWSNLDVKDLSDVFEIDRAFKEKQANNGENDKKENKMYTKKPVANFEQRDWDFDKIEAYNLQKQKKLLEIEKDKKAE